VGVLSKIMTKQAVSQPVNESYLGALRSINPRTAVSALASTGLAGLGILALLSQNSKKQKRPAVELAIEELQRLANTPIGELGPELKATAERAGGFSLADLALASMPGGGAL